MDAINANYQISVSQKKSFTKSNTTEFEYQGKTYSTTDSKAGDIFSTMNKYLTEDSPYLTAKDVHNFRGDLDYILPAREAVGYQNPYVGETNLQAMNRLLDYYQDADYSDGGKDITQGEIGEILDKFCNWNLD